MMSKPPCVLKNANMEKKPVMQFFLKFLKIYTILKVTFHFQLIQNTYCISCVV